jgi:hypothetical protein
MITPAMPASLPMGGADDSSSRIRDQGKSRARCWWGVKEDDCRPIKDLPGAAHAGFMPTDMVALLRAHSFPCPRIAKLPR